MSTSCAFSDSRGSTAEHVPDTTPEGYAASGRSKSTNNGSLASQKLADDSDGEEISQKRVGSLGLGLQEAGGSKDVDTANGGRHGEVHVIHVKVETGLWGPDGLLAVPHVNTVLFLACLLMVRG